MTTQLGSLFRVSLSRGKTIISIEDEIRHAKQLYGDPEESVIKMRSR